MLLLTADNVPPRFLPRRCPRRGGRGRRGGSTGLEEVSGQADVGDLLGCLELPRYADILLPLKREGSVRGGGGWGGNMRWKGWATG